MSENTECDFCNNVISDKSIMVLCDGCRKYMNCKMRRRLLQKALGKNGLVIRDDSITSKKYIRGDEDTTLESVVNTMLEMNFYIQHTDYRTLIKELVKYHCTSNSLPLNTKINDNVVMNDIRKKSKTIALDRYIRIGKSMDNIPDSLKDIAEIIALEVYFDI